MPAVYYFAPAWCCLDPACGDENSLSNCTASEICKSFGCLRQERFYCLSSGVHWLDHLRDEVDMGFNIKTQLHAAGAFNGSDPVCLYVCLP